MGEADTQLRFAASRTTGVRVVRTSTKWWDFPYCKSCHYHAFQWRGRNSWFALLMFPLLALIYPLIDDSSAAIVMTVIAFAAAGCVALAIGHRRRALREVRDISKASCACPGEAVEFEGWDGSLQSFQFANQMYAKEFMRKNRSKLVNVHPAVLAELGIENGRAARGGDG